MIYSFIKDNIFFYVKFQQDKDIKFELYINDFSFTDLKSKENPKNKNTNEETLNIGAIKDAQQQNNDNKKEIYILNNSQKKKPPSIDVNIINNNIDKLSLNENNNNIFSNKQKNLTSRNKKSKLTYQSSDELMKIAMTNRKTKNSSKQVYTNEHFKSHLPAFAENLPKSIYHVYQYKNKNAIKNCSICLDNFVIGTEIVTLPCFHFFHCDCIGRWLNKKKNCPICLNPI